jgi:pimeloyl-ACP methyl ester carboxylesterase
MSAITIDNNLVHYEVLGRGRPVILIHGWLGSWRYWIPTMQQLSVKYRLYALDLWGFGDTEKDATRYSFASQVKLLTDFMDKMGITKAAIVGHSLGAAVTITFTRQFPERAPRIVLVNPPLFDMGGISAAQATPPTLPPLPPITPPQSTDAGDTLRRNPLRERLAELQAVQASPPPPTGSGMSAAVTAARQPDPLAAMIGVRPEQQNPLVNLLSTINPKSVLERQLGRDDENLPKLRAEVEKADVTLFARSAPSFNGVNLAQQLGQLTSPAMVLHGKGDTFTPPNEDLLSRIEQLKARGMFLNFVVPEFRHFPMLESTAKFNRLINDFLDAPDLANVTLKETWQRQLR